MKLVYLEWVDSSSQGSSTWIDVDSVLRSGKDDSMKCVSVGFVLSDDDDSILLASHLSGDCEVKMVGHCSGNMQIPKLAITNRVDLEVPGAGRET